MMQRIQPVCFFILLLLTALETSGSPFSQTSLEDNLRDAERSRNVELLKKYALEAYQAAYYSTGLLNWNYNALMSVDENALLLTAGPNDTWPAIVLQQALGIRTDVVILPALLLSDRDYTARLFKEKQIDFLQNTAGSAAILNKLADHASQKPAVRPSVYFSILSDIDEKLIDKNFLFVTGLALKYLPGQVSNLAELQQNIENKMLLDYLKVDFSPKNEPATLADLNMKYQLALFIMHKVYAETGQGDKALEMETLALSIAQKTGRETEIKEKLRKKNDNKRPLSSLLSVKTLEKPMKKINGKLYASEIELSNGQYELFLQDLVRNREFDLLEICKTNHTEWRSLLPEKWRNLPDEILFKNANPDAPEAPIQNISHEAAKKYCAWITEVYNLSADKKKYKKVVFRLPTEAEWIEAARGGIGEAAFPWGGRYVRNSKGCYLGNYDASEPCGDCPDQMQAANDGGYFPVKVDSYFPNRFGMYNISGNVAEMIDVPGKAKGGSWRHLPYMGGVEPIIEYNAPNPAIGFRVFMEIIEE
jgi:formylglycine-generating enzyme required for sulfatase activity